MAKPDGDEQAAAPAGTIPRAKNTKPPNDQARRTSLEQIWEKDSFQSPNLYGWSAGSDNVELLSVTDIIAGGSALTASAECLIQ